MTVYGAVFARGGSKGVPGKNLRRIAGSTLLEISIGLGTASTAIDRVLCSTDSAEIAREAERLGAEVPFMRPEHLAGDDSPEWESWRHLADHLLNQGASRSDALVSLPTTSPLRIAADIERALHLFESRKFDAVLAVTESTHSPWFNVVTRDDEGSVSLVSPPSGSPVFRRQDAPQAWDITTVVYVTSLGYIMQSQGLFDGKVGSVTIPRERSIDIDTELDLDIAEYLANLQLGE